ncbi:MAG: DUF4333 domain-containing protein [Patulibacter sp.]|nr:DUF4333 domain-containing protein [Patulibacter sp.]
MSARVRPTSTLLGASLAVGCAAVLAACGGSSSDDAGTTTAAQGPFLDTKVVALAITDSIRNQRDMTAEVTCPEQIPQAKGVTFVCEAATRNGRSEFVVTQKDDQGNVDYVAADEDEPAAGTTTAP